MYRFVGAGLVAAAVAAVVIIVPTAFSRSGPTPAGPLPTVTLDVPRSPAVRPQQPMPTPVIASSALALADRQMAESATLKAFTGGVAYEIKKQGKWSNMDSSVELGLVREVSFAEPITTRMQPWPVIVWGAVDYRQYAYNAQYKNVTSAHLYLDKAKGLVAIIPGPGSETIQGPGNDWVDSLPKQGDR